MYSKQEASAIKRKFWTVFGQYMKPVRSATGEIINWVNYKTGIRDIFFRMEATTFNASISIEITHKDPGLRKMFFDKFRDTRTVLEETAGNDWIWQENYTDEHGRQTGKISKDLPGVNILNENDWPAIISFLKKEIIAIDQYWSFAKDMFEN